MQKPFKIILLGYMGSGKSTVGEGLADRLELPFKDLDDQIEKQENSSVSNIFDQKGAIYFRKVEHKLLKKLLSSDESLILSLGGGTPCYYDNMQMIRKTDAARSIYLNVALPTLADRLWEERSHRPLISGIDTPQELTEFIGKHLFERRSFYQQADLSLKIKDQSAEAIVEDILMCLF